MILTLYYMYSTIVQWWRLGSLRNKLSGTLNSHNALVVCTGDTISEGNHRRCLENLLFHNEDRIGCTVVPKRHVDLDQWMAFPRDYTYFPIFFSDSKTVLRSPKIYLLVQAQLSEYTKHQSEILQVENFGELVAWRAPDLFEVILKTDMNNLTKLVNSFCDHGIDINHELRLIKIETVDVEGSPIKIKYESRFPLEQRVKYSLAPVHWRKFATQVQQLYLNYPQVSPTKVLDRPTITIIKSTSSKSDEKKVPVTEVKPMKKAETAKHLHKQPQPRKESKNKLEVAPLDTRRTKSSERKLKERKEVEKKREHRKSEAEEPKAKPKLAASGSGDHKPKPKLRKMSRQHSKDEEKIKEVNGHAGGDAKAREKVVTEVAAVSGESTSEVREENLATQKNSKPPNVLVYAESALAKDNVKNVLHAILNNHKYTVYDFPTGQANSPWTDATALVVVCGNVPPSLTSQLLQYLVSGGKLLCLCSDLLYSVLHMFSTAEVREHELVRFSYGTWKRVKMMHHVFCYQASPAKRQFSKDSDHSNHSSRGSSPVAPRTPSAVEIQHGGNKYTIQVQVLGAEETWHTPSLLLASVKNCKGSAIFSQVHLEIDPTQYQDDENKYQALKDSNRARLEIMKHILSQHLGLDCSAVLSVEYSPGYFLGMHNLKQELLSTCAEIEDNKLSTEKLTVKFSGKGVEPEAATAAFLPVLIHACPSNFSTVRYFETLNTTEIGRLVIYTDILTSSQFIVSKQLKHGFVAIVRQQTQGIGRSSNTWLSPLGCAMFSVQLHVPLASTLGKYLPLVQHLVMVSVVSAIKGSPQYEDIDLGLKWPNDLYANRNIKIGGLLVSSSICSSTAYVNVGVGVNLDNSEPTTCINDLIRSYNDANQVNLATIGYEVYFAMVFNELEEIFRIVQEGNLDHFFDLYYKYWLHSEAEVTVSTSDGSARKATIIGIDEYGFLRVRSEDGVISNVQPDGNSFDMLKGLVAPKIF